MKPPTTINVLDKHSGFTAITLSTRYEREGLVWKKIWRESDSLWRPGKLLRKTTIGTLDELDENSFFQNNSNVTKALYKVPGYRFRIAVWFDNATCERIA